MPIIEDRIRELGIELPPPGDAQGDYVNAMTVGDLVYIAGHGPFEAGKPAIQGRVGADLTLQQAKQSARLTMLNCLATLRSHIGDLDHVRRVVKVFGMVRATPEFDRHPEAIDGASQLLLEVFSERGVHTRSAVGMGSLPFGIPVEIEMVVQLHNNDEE